MASSRSVPCVNSVMALSISEIETRRMPCRTDSRDVSRYAIGPPIRLLHSVAKSGQEIPESDRRCAGKPRVDKGLAWKCDCWIHPNGFVFSGSPVFSPRLPAESDLHRRGVAFH